MRAMLARIARQSARKIAQAFDWLRVFLTERNSSVYRRRNKITPTHKVSARARRPGAIVGLAALLIALTGALALGPRVRVETPDLDIDLPRDLVDYLHERESSVPGILAGAEKTIAWADPAARAVTDHALVYLHGYSATRQETDPLTRLVGENLGANVFYTRLRGHGRGPLAMGEAKAADWLRDTREAFEIGRRIGDKVIVIGVSTGATLAAWLALQPDTNELNALVFISPNFALANGNARVLKLPWGVPLARALSGPMRSFEAVNESQARYWTTSYPIESAGELMALISYVNDFDLGTISQPLLYIRSDRDTVIDMDAADRAFERVSSTIRKQVIVTNSNDRYGHVIAGDILSPDTTKQLAAAITEFVRSLDGND